MNNVFKFKSLNAPLSLTRQHVDIWYFSLAKQPSEAFSLLNEEEQQRGLRFHFPHHQRRFITARARLRQLLAAYLNKHPAEIAFDYQAHGKPYLAATSQGIQFNLSHSKDHAVVAITQDDALGIDIECFSKRPYEGLAQAHFSKQEQHDLKKAPMTLQPLLFFKIWTQKEALIKAIGQGLSYPTQAFDVISDHQTSFSIIHSDAFNNAPATAWQMLTCMPFPAVFMALCCHPQVEHIHYYGLDDENT